MFTLQTLKPVKYKFEYLTSQPELKIALLFLLSCLSNICCSHVLYPLAASFKHSWKILFTYLCQLHVEEIILFHFNSAPMGLVQMKKKTPMKKYLKHLTQLEKVVMHFFGKQQFDSPHTSHMYHELCMKRLKYTSLSPCIN